MKTFRWRSVLFQDYTRGYIFAQGNTPDEAREAARKYFTENYEKINFCSPFSETWPEECKKYWLEDKHEFFCLLEDDLKEDPSEMEDVFYIYGSA